MSCGTSAETFIVNGKILRHVQDFELLNNIHSFTDITRTLVGVLSTHDIIHSKSTRSVIR